MIQFSDRINQYRKLFPNDLTIHFRLCRRDSCATNIVPIVCGALSLYELDEYGNIRDIELSPYLNAKKYMNSDTRCWIEQGISNSLSIPYLSTRTLIILVEE